ncbi:ATP-binding protein [marine bacterium AO1-C]|nr:ATP-binding protein [marine bacterium AO1-C]
MEKSAAKNILSIEKLSIGYLKNQRIIRTVARDLELCLKPGEFVCLLGANGSGKSTLMRTIAGVQPAIKGEVLLDNTLLKKLKPAQIAQRLSMVLTEKITVGNLSVQALVSLGRTPYTGWLGRLRPEDQEIIDWALEVTETTEFRHRNVNQLSDGETQKVMIARALAQDTPLILLDEPTAHLDLPNRVMIFKLLRKLAKQTGKAILLTTHELDLALQAADHIWLMGKKNDQGECHITTGTPEDLVLNGTFERAFAKDGFHFDKHTGAFKINEPDQKKIYLRGTGIQAFWTQRALEREGYLVTQDANVSCEVALSGDESKDYSWTIRTDDTENACHSVKDLLQVLRKL